MTRTTSPRRLLSLGSCIRAAVTVLSSRTILPGSSLSSRALASTVRLGRSRVWSGMSLRPGHEPSCAAPRPQPNLPADTASASVVMVATESIEQELKTRKFRRLVRWSRGVDTNLFRPYGKDLSDFSTFPRPILLYVGRVAVEKNLREFLDIDTVGSQIVVGDGPDLASLKREYPDVHFLGALSGEKLACHYAAADLFVFPSIADTFGLVLLEACAAGLRVAAMPVPGPSDIFADDTAKDFAAMDWDLGRAVETALQLRDNSDAPRAFAHRFTWQACTQEFYAHLQAPAPKAAPKLSALAQADCRSNPLGGGPCKAEQSRRPSNAPDMTKRGRHGPGIETHPGRLRPPGGP